MDAMVYKSLMERDFRPELAERYIQEQQFVQADFDFDGTEKDDRWMFLFEQEKGIAKDINLAINRETRKEKKIISQKMSEVYLDPCFWSTEDYTCCETERLGETLGDWNGDIKFQEWLEDNGFYCIGDGDLNGEEIRIWDYGLDKIETAMMNGEITHKPKFLELAKEYMPRSYSEYIRYTCEWEPYTKGCSWYTGRRVK